MKNTFGEMFKVNRKTVGLGQGEDIPSDLKRKAVEAVVVANIIEPQAFQIGAIKIAILILESDSLGFSSSWFYNLNPEDIYEINKIMFEMKNYTHSKNGVKNIDPDSTRSEDSMIDLFKSYAWRGNEILVSIEHHVGHILSNEEIKEILYWIHKKRMTMSKENAEYRKLLVERKRGSAMVMLIKIYKELLEEFKISDQYFKLIENMNWINRKGLDFSLQKLFLGTFSN